MAFLPTSARNKISYSSQIGMTTSFLEKRSTSFVHLLTRSYARSPLVLLVDSPFFFFGTLEGVHFVYKLCIWSSWILKSRIVKYLLAEFGVKMRGEDVHVLLVVITEFLLGQVSQMKVDDCVIEILSLLQGKVIVHSYAFTFILDSLIAPVEGYRMHAIGVKQLSVNPLTCPLADLWSHVLFPFPHLQSHRKLWLSPGPRWVLLQTIVSSSSPFAWIYAPEKKQGNPRLLPRRGSERGHRARECNRTAISN